MAKQKTDQSTPTESTSTLSFQRQDDFASRYANNIRVEATVHDLKLVFGQSDLSSGSEVIKQHTAVTIPWSAFKVGLYFLYLNLAFHELYNGSVPVAACSPVGFGNGGGTS